jgi:hypothetical protein
MVLGISNTGEFAGEEIVVYDTGTCSGKCQCGDAGDWTTCSCTGDCTMANFGPLETEDGNAFSLAGPRTGRTYGRYLRHWTGPSDKNTVSERLHSLCKFSREGVTGWISSIPQ